MEETTKQVPNPTGKGGFGEHPENRSDGRWDKRNSFSYWMNYFKAMTVKEFTDYKNTNPEDKRTVAETLAYTRVFKAREELREFEVVANRTEGMPKQSLDLGLDESIEKVAIEIIKSKNEESKPSSDSGVPEDLGTVSEEGKENNNSRGGIGEQQDSISGSTDGDDNAKGKEQADNDSKEIPASLESYSDEGFSKYTEGPGSI